LQTYKHFLNARSANLPIGLPAEGMAGRDCLPVPQAGIFATLSLQVKPAKIVG